MTAAEGTDDPLSRLWERRVLRFWNNDVMSNIDGVLQTIADAATPSPRPSPAERERG